MPKGQRHILYLLIFFCAYSLPVHGQVNTERGQLQYLFPAFTSGKVKMKTGEAYSVPLNYQVLSREMVFDKNGHKMALAQPEDVDTIYLQEIRFVYTGSTFYEVLYSDSISLFTEYRARIESAPTPIGFGASSQSTQAVPISTYKSLYGANYSLEIAQKDYVIVPEQQHWIRFRNNYYPAENLKEILKIFPEKSDTLKSFVKSGKLNINRSDDLIQLVAYCNQLYK